MCQLGARWNDLFFDQMRSHFHVIVCFLLAWFCVWASQVRLLLLRMCCCWSRPCGFWIMFSLSLFVASTPLSCCALSLSGPVVIVTLRKRATETCTLLERIAWSLVYTVKEMGMWLTGTEAMGVRWLGLEDKLITCEACHAKSTDSDVPESTGVWHSRWLTCGGNLTHHTSMEGFRQRREHTRPPSSLSSRQRTNGNNRIGANKDGAHMMDMARRGLRHRIMDVWTRNWFQSIRTVTCSRERSRTSASSRACEKDRKSSSSRSTSCRLAAE